MGVYQGHLYQSAMAGGLKTEFAGWLAVSHSLDGTVERLQKRYDVGFVAVTAEAAMFWIALADQMHQFGLDHEATFRIANKLIDSGEALRLEQEAGASRETLAAHTRTLRRLREKWKTPAKRTRKVPPLKPERFVMQAGDVFTYGTKNGNPNHPDGLSSKPKRFLSDARNAFVCFNTARVFFDTQARYFIVPVALFDRDKRVAIDDVARAQLVCHCDISTRSFAPVGDWMSWDKQVLKALSPQFIGSMDPNLPALERVFGKRVYAPLTADTGAEYPLWMNFGLLSNVARGHVWGGPEDRVENYVKAWAPC